MSYIQTGTEWQVRALAAAAEAFAQAATDGSIHRGYGCGFADALTFILGGMDDKMSPEVTAIYRRYLDRIDGDDETVSEDKQRGAEYRHELHGWVGCTVLAGNATDGYVVDLGMGPSVPPRRHVEPTQLRWV